MQHRRAFAALVVALAGAASTALVRAESFEELYARETSVNASETIATYAASARSGSCASAKRLGEIYERGLLGIQRDYAESLKWFHAAQVLGCGIAPTSTSPTAKPEGQPKNAFLSKSGALLQTASALETDGKGAEAVKAYVHAARNGSCEAARRLGEIYDKGLLGKSRDYPESLKWYNAARVLGCEVPLTRTN